MTVADAIPETAILDSISELTITSLPVPAATEDIGEEIASVDSEEESFHDETGVDEHELSTKDEEPLYCFCRKPMYGKMLAWDGLCQGMFYYVCINIQRRPRAKKMVL